MTPAKLLEIQDFSPTNNNDRSGNRKSATGKKIFIHRNSVLTNLSLANIHFRSIHYAVITAVCFLFSNTAIFYLTEPSKFREDIGIIRWACSKFPQCLMFWILFNLFAFAIYEGFKLWTIVRSRICSKGADKIFLYLYLASILLTFVVAASYMFKIKFRPILGLAIGCEQVRIYMKIHSYVRENASRVMQNESQKDGSQLHIVYPTRKHYLYYLFAPTFLYRDFYPRTETRDWGKVIHYLCKVILTILVAYCIYMRFYIEVLKTAGLRPFTIKEVAIIFAGCTVTAPILMFLLFFGLFHSWLNSAAEFLKFGDREFYQDWWNCITVGQFFRKWNVVVNDWLYSYIYSDLLKLGYSNLVSLVLVFLISATFHEYILCIAIGYCYPLVFVQYLMGSSLIMVTKRNKSEYWNAFLWWSITVSWTIFLLLSAVEWYARKNCPKEETFSDFFLLRSWDTSCRIFEFL